MLRHQFSNLKWQKMDRSTLITIWRVFIMLVFLASLLGQSPQIAHADPCFLLTLSHTPPGGGSDPIASPTNSADCSAGAGYYHVGELITLSGASPDLGWQIAGWVGTDNDGLTTSTNTLTMPPAVHTVSVTYTQICYALTLSHTGNGSDPVADPTSSPGCPSTQYVYGESIALSGAVPDTGWQIASWTGTADDNLTTSTNTLTMPAVDNYLVQVNYTEICYALTLSHTGNGSDPVADPTSSPGCPSTQYVYGESISLSGAVPDTGWQIASWTGTDNNSSTASTNSLTMPAVNNYSVLVNYTEICYALTLSHTGNGSDPVASPTSSTGCSSGQYHYLEPIALSGASPNLGWQIAGWTGTDNNSSTLSTNTLTMPPAASAASVTYTQICYTLTLSHTGNGSNPVASPTNSFGCPSGQYTVLESIALSGALPDPGWQIAGWKGTDNDSSTAITNSLTMPASNHLTSVAYIKVSAACDVTDLIAVINAADSYGLPSTINLASNCSYNLTSAYATDPDGYGPVGLPLITGNITLVGNNATIARSGSNVFRLFYVPSGGILTLQNLTLSNGLAQGGNGGISNGAGGGGGAGLGGAIFNRGTLTLSGATLQNNLARGGNGGFDAILNGLYGGGGGGGMGGNGVDGFASDGGAGGGANGGAGGNGATNNGTGGGVGGGGGGGALNNGNGGIGGFGGGGGASCGYYNVNGGNGGFGGGGGGGASGQYGGNFGVAGFGGGNGGQWQGGGGGGMGGAIFNEGGTLNLTNSQFIRNCAQGGNGGVDVLPSQPATPNGNGGSGYGGAIFSDFGTLNLITTTVTFDANCVVAGTTDHTTGAIDGQAAGQEIYRYPGGPTAVTVASFAAQPQAAGVQLAWQTLMEIDLLGFNVYRSTAPDGAPGWQKLNAALIPATALGGGLGQSYEYIDNQVQPGLKYYYWLEAVNKDGKQLFGPQSAGQFTMLYLPSVLK